MMNKIQELFVLYSWVCYDTQRSIPDILFVFISLYANKPLFPLLTKSWHKHLGLANTITRIKRSKRGITAHSEPQVRHYTSADPCKTKTPKYRNLININSMYMRFKALI